METLTYNIDFEMLCAKYNLGQLTTEPEQIFGGFLHKMYQLKTDKNVYAVKALNPQIMQRKTAMNNYILSEKVANIAYQNGIHAVTAIVSEGSFMHEVDGQYYLLFPWVQGRSLPAGIIDIESCNKIGRVLANIHTTDFSELMADTQIDRFDPSVVDWNDYASKGIQTNIEWAPLLIHNLNQIYQYEKLANASVEKVMSNRVISHRDLDPKNVLWDENHDPILIDWESAGITNPTQELIDVALYWSGFETSDFSKEAFCRVIYTYLNHGGKICDHLHDVLNYGFQGKLDWLAYNFRRSLRLECTDDTDQALGTSEVIRTIQALNDYADFIPVCTEWITEILVNEN